MPRCKQDKRQDADIEDYGQAHCYRGLFVRPPTQDKFYKGYFKPLSRSSHGTYSRNSHAPFIAVAILLNTACSAVKKAGSAAISPIRMNAASMAHSNEAMPFRSAFRSCRDERTLIHIGQFLPGECPLTVANPMRSGLQPSRTVAGTTKRPEAPLKNSRLVPAEEGECRRTLVPGAVPYDKDKQANLVANGSGGDVAPRREQEKRRHAETEVTVTPITIKDC